MSPPRKCSRENCPTQNISPDLTVTCHSCKNAVHLLCYGIVKNPEEIFVIDNIVMICDSCINNLVSPKRKQPNTASNMIQSTIDPLNPMLTISKSASNVSTPPKPVKQSQMQAMIETLVQKVETQTATIAGLKFSVDSMNTTISKQKTTVEQSIKQSSDSMTSIEKKVADTPRAADPAKKSSYANVLKGSVKKRKNNETPKTSRPSQTPRTDKPVQVGMSKNVIGKPLSPDQNRRNIQPNGAMLPQKAIWVSKLHRDTTEEELETYVKTLVGDPAADQYQVRKLVKKDRPLSSYSFVSFRISCPEAMLTTLLDAENWPSNCQIREFDMQQQTSTGARLSVVSPKSTDGVQTSTESKNEMIPRAVEMDFNSI